MNGEKVVEYAFRVEREAPSLGNSKTKTKGPANAGCLYWKFHRPDQNLRGPVIKVEGVTPESRNTRHAMTVDDRGAVCGVQNSRTTAGGAESDDQAARRS